MPNIRALPSGVNVTDSDCCCTGTPRTAFQSPSGLPAPPFQAYAAAVKYPRSTSVLPSGENAPSVTQGTSPTRRKMFVPEDESVAGPS